jgi:hypothetical protein
MPHPAPFDGGRAVGLLGDPPRPAAPAPDDDRLRIANGGDRLAAARDPSNARASTEMLGANELASGAGEGNAPARDHDLRRRIARTEDVDREIEQPFQSLRGIPSTSEAVPARGGGTSSSSSRASPSAKQAERQPLTPPPVPQPKPTPSQYPLHTERDAEHAALADPRSEARPPLSVDQPEQKPLTPPPRPQPKPAPPQYASASDRDTEPAARAIPKSEAMLASANVAAPTTAPRGGTLMDGGTDVVCVSYRSGVSADGRRATVAGMACRRTDGEWWIVSQAAE